MAELNGKLYRLSVIKKLNIHIHVIERNLSAHINI